MSKRDLASIKGLEEGDEISQKSVIASKLIYSSNGFVIFLCKGGFSVKGNFEGTIIPGASYKITGTITSYKSTKQIDASLIEEACGENKDILIISDFIKGKFPKLGGRASRKIAEEHGKSALSFLSTGGELIKKYAPNLTKETLDDIEVTLNSKILSYERELDLCLIGLSSKNATKALSSIGIDALTKINKNPFVLLTLPDIGFVTCENLRINLNLPLLSTGRFSGAMYNVLQELHESTGDTFFDLGTIKHDVVSFMNSYSPKEERISFEDPMIQGYLDDAIDEGIKNHLFNVYEFKNNKCQASDITNNDARIALRSVFLSEAKIKSEIESFINAPTSDMDPAFVEKSIRKLSYELGLTPNENQLKALFNAITKPFSIITGGPGTGKTTIIGILAEHFRRAKIKALYCAPTGRAAKRMSEASGVYSSTIHKLLEVTSGEDDEVFYGRSRLNPLDTRVIVVDEVSMIDTFLMSKLLDATPKGASVILIGDPNQLPSVGPGNVLADLLSSDIIPITKLDYVYRQQKGSLIASVANGLLEGIIPIEEGEEFKVIDVKSEEDGLQRLLEIYKEKSENEDICILSPTKKNLLGTVSVNKILQNVTYKEDPFLVKSDYSLFEGDRIMQIKNNYRIEYLDIETREKKEGVFNGELGVVSDIDSMLSRVQVLMDDGRRISYDKKMLQDTDLAYAMTVHKSQGCEFDVVLILLGKINRLLMNRKILYTAITRGKKEVIVINCADALTKMTMNDYSIQRKTSLKDFLNIIKEKRNR